MKHILILCLTAWAIGAAPASAFEAATADAAQAARCNEFPEAGFQNFCLSGYEVAALRLPSTASAFGTFSGTGSMAIYKPDGAGPFPAIVLLHTCGAISPDQTRYWVKSTIAKGYVAFILDSWSQRNLPNGTCDIVKPGFNTTSVRLRDAYDALARLEEIPSVDVDHVAAVGFSHGARMAYMLANAGTAKMFSTSGRHFTAAVAVYGECYNRPTKFAYLRPPVDIPLLALLGDNDADGDVTQCQPRLEAIKAAGAPVEWHIFPGVGHAWDQPNFSSAVMRPYPGSPTGTVLYKYDPRVTDESRDRAFAFLSPLLKK